jgi:transcriptional regulator with PAS, ATPase and Fis domain
MEKNFWVKELGASVTVSDREGIILEMNDQAIQSYEKDGGAELIGKNMLDCHPEPARTTLVGLMEQEKINIYMIKKHGKKKIIYQTPVYKDGVYSGFMEMSLELPDDMEFFDRDQK